MATQKPLIIDTTTGQVRQIAAGDTLSAAASAYDVITATNANVGAIVIGTPVYASAAGAVDKANASASGTTRVLGIVRDTSIAPSGAGHIQLDGIVSATTGQWDAVAGTTGGLTAGTRYFLSATAGLITSTPPSASGNYVCEIGVAVSTTELEMGIDRGGVLLA